MATALNAARTIELLDAIIEVLRHNGEPGWADSMSGVAGELRRTQRQDPEAYRDELRRLLQVYAGMGSFSDVVLQNSQGVLSAHTQFDRMRAALFALIVDQVGTEPA